MCLGTALMRALRVNKNSKVLGHKTKQQLTKKQSLVIKSLLHSLSDPQYTQTFNPLVIKNIHKGSLEEKLEYQQVTASDASSSSVNETSL